MDDKIKVLFLASDPFHGGAALRLDEEVRAVQNAIRRGKARDAVVLVPHFATRTRDLREALLEHKPQIVHFAGHGNPSGGIYLGDEHGRRQAVSSEALRKLFGIIHETVKVVVLNGCDTLSTIELLSEVVDYTVGMNSVISDDAAIVFAEAFYSTLAMGESVLAAFDWAVCQLHLEGNVEAATPERRIRRGVNLDLPLVAPRPEEAETPALPAVTTGSPPAHAAGLRNEFEQRFEVDDVLFENAPRPDGAPHGGGGTLNRFKGDVKGRNYTFRNLG
jgi:hypothetical protein